MAFPSDPPLCLPMSSLCHPPPPPTFPQGTPSRGGAVGVQERGAATPAPVTMGRGQCSNKLCLACLRCNCNFLLRPLWRSSVGYFYYFFLMEYCHGPLCVLRRSRVCVLLYSLIECYRILLPLRVTSDPTKLWLSYTALTF